MTFGVQTALMNTYSLRRRKRLQMTNTRPRLSLLSIASITSGMSCKF